MKCHIIKDLLPNHIDGLNSEETSAEISKHLEDCADCRSIHEKMTTEMEQDVKPEDKDIDFLKRLRAKILRKNVIVSLSTCLVLVTGLLAYAFNYEIPIPFDKYRMSAEVIPFAILPLPDGTTTWTFFDTTSPEGEHTNELPEGYEFFKDGLTLAYSGFDNIGGGMIGRDIDRNGEHVRVVYYRYTKTPWVRLFFDYDLVEGIYVSGRESGSPIYGDSYGSADYETQMIEIYYLPVSAPNLSSVERLSDRAYDALRHDAILVWSGEA